jgi:hypothetical protein
MRNNEIYSFPFSPKKIINNNQRINDSIKNTKIIRILGTRFIKQETSQNNKLLRVKKIKS